MGTAGLSALNIKIKPCVLPNLNGFRMSKAPASELSTSVRTADTAEVGKTTQDRMDTSDTSTVAKII
jgi:hypothetical protein